MKYMLGKKPARKDAVLFKFKDYAMLRTAPSSTSHYKLVSDWQGMMGNDQLGDCVCAEAGHGTVYFNKLAGKSVTISTKNVVDMYSAVTGYTPSDPNSDQGTDMQEAASYRLKTGLTDVNNTRHKIGAYVALTPGNVAEIKQAIYYFGGIGLGIEFPASANTQFEEGKNWTVVSNSPTEGGHDVWVCGYSPEYVYLVTWGKLIKATWGFVKKYMDEGIVYLSPEFLTGGKSLEGFNFTQLKADLSQLK